MARRNPLPLAAGALLCLALAAPLGAQTPTPPAVRADSLSLPGAIALARENNPDLLQQANDLAPARAAVRSAMGNAYLPSASLGTSFSYTAAGQPRFQSVEFAEQPAFYSSSYGLNLRYTLDGSQLLQPSVARSEENATVRRIRNTERTLVANVTQQYLAVLQAGALAEQAEREVERTGQNVRLAEARREVGLGISLDVRRAEVEQGQAEVRLLQAQTQRKTEALRLAQLVGVPLEPTVPLSTGFELFEPTLDREALTLAALQSNPALLASRAAANAAGTRLVQAKTRYLPSLSAGLNFSGFAQRAANIDPLVQSSLAQTGRSFEACQQQNRLGQLIGQPPTDCTPFNVNDPAVANAIRAGIQDRNSGFPFGYTRQPWSADLAISFPLFDNFSRNLQVQQSQAATADARYQVRALELQLRQEVGSAVLSVETAYRTAQILARARATAAEELRLAEARFRAGAANSLEVVDAQTRLSEAERAQIDAIYSFHRSYAALEALVGRALPAPTVSPAPETP